MKKKNVKGFLGVMRQLAFNDILVKHGSVSIMVVTVLT